MQCRRVRPPRSKYCRVSKRCVVRYTASPPAIGSRAGYIPPPLLRLALTLDIYRLPSCDWLSRWVILLRFAGPPAPTTARMHSTPQIGSHAGYILPPLLRLVRTSEGRRPEQPPLAHPPLPFPHPSLVGDIGLGHHCRW
eukprot:1183197-Prorocentrum_minimum.AAC.1